MADETVTIRTRHRLSRDRRLYPKGSVVTVKRTEYDRNPGMGEIVTGKETPEMAMSGSAVELPVEGAFGALPEFNPDDQGPHVSAAAPRNGPLVEQLVAKEEPALRKARRGRKPKKTT